MTQDYKLHLKVGNGHLRLTPKGPLSARTVEQLLGVARSALTFFSMLTMDLREAWEVREVYLALLEKGLQQLISEKKLALTCEMPQLRWVAGPSPSPDTACKCGGLCQDCPH